MGLLFAAIKIGGTYCISFFNCNILSSALYRNVFCWTAGRRLVEGQIGRGAEGQTGRGADNVKSLKV